jgi:MFS family permease
VLAALAVTSIQLSNTLWVTTLQERIPEHVLSRVTAYDWMVSLVFMPLGYVLAAPLVDALGRDTTLVILAALSAAGTLGILLVPSVWTMRRLADDETVDEGSPATAVA